MRHQKLSIISRVYEPPLVMIHKPFEMMIKKRLFYEVCLKKISREVKYITCFEISS